MIIKNKYATFIGHKYHGKFYVDVQKWTAPDAPATNKVLSATALKTAVQTITTGITNPDFPRVLSVTGNSSNVAGKVTITGTNIRGKVITEEITLNGSATVAGTKAFRTVTSIQLPVYSVAGTETVSVGITDKLGLQSIPLSTSVIEEVTGNADDTGGAVLTRDADEIEKCLYDPNTECNATADKAVAYLSEETDSKISSYTE